MPKDHPIRAHLEDAYAAFKAGDAAEAERMAKAVTVMARASTGKQRAGPVRRAAAHPALEDEMCGFGAEGFDHSPARVDALVWALTGLLCGGAVPRARII